MIIWFWPSELTGVISMALRLESLETPGLRDGDNILLLAIYVDDILIASNKKDWIERVKKHLIGKFAIKDLGLVGKCLGIEFKQDLIKHEVCLTQEKYVKQLLDKFGMTDCKPVSTPMEINCDLPHADENNDKDDRFPYQQLIGSLLYLAISTRPDISFAVNYLRQFNKCYQGIHWKAAKTVLRYLKGTSKYGIVYKKLNGSIIGMVDADWGGNLIDRRSTTGCIFVLANAPIYWEAKRQRTVALSSTEAEYMTMSDAAREIIYLQGLLKEMGFKIEQTIIQNDSQSAQKLIFSQDVQSRSEHIDIRYHFVMDAVKNGCIKFEYVPTDQMPADVLTKSLSGPKHLNCLIGMGMKINN